MAKFALFRRRSKQQHQGDASASQEDTIKKRAISSRLLYGSSNHSVETDRISDDSIRSASDPALLLSNKANSSPKTTRNKKKTSNTKTVRFAPPKSINSIHFHYSRLDDEIITNKDIWWDMDELDACLKADFKALLTAEQRRTKDFPEKVKALGRVMETLYNNNNNNNNNDTAWKTQLDAQLSATLEWRGLEDFMGMNAHHAVRDSHVHLILLQVGGTRLVDKTSKKKKNSKRNFKNNNKNNSSVLAVAPPSTSTVAAKMAAARAAHDAQQVGADA